MQARIELADDDLDPGRRGFGRAVVRRAVGRRCDLAKGERAHAISEARIEPAGFGRAGRADEAQEGDNRGGGRGEQPGEGVRPQAHEQPHERAESGDGGHAPTVGAGAPADGSELAGKGSAIHPDAAPGRPDNAVTSPDPASIRGIGRGGQRGRPCSTD